MGLSILNCDAGQLADVQRFFARAYSPSYALAQDTALFKWQFGAASDAGGCQFKLAVADGEIQACLGYIPVELTTGGTRVRAAWTANWMVQPSLRRLGLGPMLLRQLVQQFDAVLSLGLDRDAADILPRMGWTDFGDLDRYVAVIDVAGAAQLTASGALDWPERPKAVSTGARGTLQSIAAIGPDLEDLWDRVWGRASGTRRSAEFLHWRYAAHPRFQYRMLEWRDRRGATKGLAIYRPERVRDLPVTIARVVELVCEPDGARELIRGVFDDAAACGIAALDFFCSSRSLEPALVAEGFLPGASAPACEIPLLFQPIDRRRAGVRFMAYLAKLPPTAAVADWYVTKGDGDQDRPN